MAVVRAQSLRKSQGAAIPNRALVQVRFRWSVLQGFDFFVVVILRITLSVSLLRRLRDDGMERLDAMLKTMWRWFQVANSLHSDVPFTWRHGMLG